MNKIAICLAALFTVLATGCAPEQAYVSMQDFARDDCYKRPEADRAACLQRISVNFEVYSKARDKAINSPAK